MTAGAESSARPSNGAGLVRVEALCLDAADPAQLSRFWSAALRWPLDESGGTDGNEPMLLPVDGSAFPLVFRRANDRKVAQNRVHLDLTTESLDDQRDTVEQLLGLGARHVDIGQRPEEGHVVLADPEGNELCILEPGNRFLAGCGRLGAVNCDGLRATGVFWSEALGWPLVWDQDEETAIRPPDARGPMITWSGPPLMPKPAKNRLHLHLAPADSEHRAATLDRLLALGAALADIGQGEVTWTVLADPDGNEFCLR